MHNKKALLKPSGRCCVHCGIPIPVGRIKAFPNTNECTQHSSSTPVYGHTYVQGNVDDGFTDISIISDPDVIVQMERMKTNKPNR